MKKLIVAATITAATIFCATPAMADVTDFTHHLKRQGVNKYKLIRPDINTYNHLNVNIKMTKVVEAIESRIKIDDRNKPQGDRNRR